jgi:hypothetical protein
MTLTKKCLNEIGGMFGRENIEYEEVLAGTSQASQSRTSKINKDT